MTTILSDRDHIVRWTWRTRAKYRDLPATLEAQHPHLEIVRLHSSRATRTWLLAVADHTLSA